MSEYLAIVPYIFATLVGFLGLEILFRRQDYRFNDSIASMCSGLTLAVFEIYFRLIFVAMYAFVYDRFHLFEIPANAWSFIAGLLLIDLAQYFNHRVSHRSNFFWAAHIGHHQSETFNLSVGTRINVPNRITYLPLFLVLGVIGITPSIFLIVNLIVGIFPFWYHTRLLKRMWGLEWIIVTPAHHRVHHATNGIYIDQNYGAIFSFWDRLFGTYVRESESETYGILKRIPHHRVLNIYTLQFRILREAVREAKGFRAKLRQIFGPPEVLRVSAEAQDRLVQRATRVYRKTPYAQPWIVGGLLVSIFLSFALMKIPAVNPEGELSIRAFGLWCFTMVLIDQTSRRVESNVTLERQV